MSKLNLKIEIWATDKRAELKQLGIEEITLRMEKAILQKPSTFFAKEMM